MASMVARRGRLGQSKPASGGTLRNTQSVKPTEEPRAPEYGIDDATEIDEEAARKNPHLLVTVEITNARSNTGLRTGSRWHPWLVEHWGVVVLDGDLIPCPLGTYVTDLVGVRLIGMARDVGAVGDVNAWREFLRKHVWDGPPSPKAATEHGGPLCRKAGRPRTHSDGVRTSVLLEREDIQRLDEWAAARGLSRSEAVSAAIAALLEC